MGIERSHQIEPEQEDVYRCTGKKEHNYQEINQPELVMIR